MSPLTDQERAKLNAVLDRMKAAGASHEDIVTFIPQAQQRLQTERLKAKHERSQAEIAQLKANPENRVGDYLDAAGGSLVDKAKAIGRGVAAVASHPIETFTNDARRRELLRGVDDTVTFGYGQKLAANIDEALPANLRNDLTDEERAQAGWDRSPVASRLRSTEEADAAAAPDVRTGGSIAGAFVPGGAANLVGRGAAGVAKAAVPTVSAIGSAARAGLGYELAAPAIAGAHANAEGHRLETAGDAATDPGALLLATGTGAALGAAARGLKGAPERVAETELAGLKEGVQYKTRVQKFAANEVDIRAQLRAEPKIRGLIKRDPVKAQPLVEQAVADKADTVLEPFYRRMAASGQDQIPVNLVTDALKQVKAGFNRVTEKAQIAAVDDYIAGFEAEAQGNSGRLPAQFVRESATSMQKQGYASVPMFGQVALPKGMKQDVGNALRGAVADHLESLTPNTGAGKALREAFHAANREVSTWYKIKDIVDEKATRVRGNASATGDVVRAVAGAINSPIRTAIDVGMSAARPVAQLVDRRILAPVASSRLGRAAIGAVEGASPVRPLVAGEVAGSNPVIVARQADKERERRRAGALATRGRP